MGFLAVWLSLCRYFFTTRTQAHLLFDVLFLVAWSSIAAAVVALVSRRVFAGQRAGARVYLDGRVAPKPPDDVEQAHNPLADAGAASASSLKPPPRHPVYFISDSLYEVYKAVW